MLHDFYRYGQKPLFRVLYQKVPTLTTIRVKECLTTLDRSKVMGSGWEEGGGYGTKWKIIVYNKASTQK